MVGILTVLCACTAVEEVRESNAASAMSPTGAELIFHDRPWQPDRVVQSLYVEQPEGAAAPAWQGVRFALPSVWPRTPGPDEPWSNTTGPIEMITLETVWAAAAPGTPPVALGLGLYHRVAGSAAAWQNVRCDVSGAIPPEADQHFRAETVVVDPYARVIEGVLPSPPGIPPAHVEEPPSAWTFESCGVTEPNPEFAEFVAPSDGNLASPWLAYDLSVRCDGEPCPGYVGTL